MTESSLQPADPIDRSSPLPLYAQIKRRLLQMIVSWDAPDNRFHTDEELCRLFKVSRMTVRQAVQELVNEQHLIRVRGVGTFVGTRKVDEHPDRNFIDQWAGSGRELVMKVRHLGVQPCPPAYCGPMQLDEGAEVLYLERLRISGGIPISIDHRYILTEFAAVLDRPRIERSSLLDLIRERVELDHGVMRIEAGKADAELAEILQILPSDPVLERSLVYLDIAGRPVMAGRSVYRADQARYVVTVPVARGASPAPMRLCLVQSD